MTFPKIGYLLRPISTSSTIKNTVELEQSENLYKGYSASGQDVWLPYFDYDGPAIVLSAVGAQCGKTFLADGKWGTVANTTAFAVDIARASSKFLHYLTNQKDFWEKGGSAQPYVKVSETLRRRFFVPNLPTQRAIADFLDRETARIDTLIEKKQRLVELLGEKKKAALSRIEEELYSFETGASRLSYHVSKVGSGKTPSGGANVYQDSGIIFLRSQNIKNDSISLDDVAYISEEIDAEMAGSRVKGGDVLLNITGASLGRCAVAPLDLPSANVNQHVCIIRPVRHLLAEYLHVLLLAPRMQATIKTEAFSAGREGLNFQSIRNFLIPVPQSVKVQASIVDRISRITTQDGKIIAVSERSIERLKEYRSALITSAVTGQIDVTKWTNAGTTDRQLDAIEEEFGV